jgi:hypothetical protein
VGPSSNSSQIAVAACPDSTQVYSGGGKVIDGRGEFMLDSLEAVPNDDGPDIFRATAKRRTVRNTAIAVREWSLEVFAVCGPELPGYEKVTVSDISAEQRVTANAACPDGKRVIGAGGAVSDPSDRFSFETLSPDADGTSVTVTGVDDLVDGVEAEFRNARAVAICAFEPDAYQIVSSETSFRPGNPKTVDASCPDGTVGFSAGFTKEDLVGHAVVDEASPLEPDRSSPGPETVRITSREPRSVVQYSLTSRVVCGSLG